MTWHMDPPLKAVGARKKFKAQNGEYKFERPAYQYLKGL
jgi:hypothetical protein